MAEVIPQEPVKGTVEFIQHALPGLDPGAYMLDVAQTVSEQPQPFENRYFFAVQGPRFALNPNDIFATYPPDQAEGEFDATLPHAVLVNRTLPWQRFPTLDAPERYFPNSPHDRDVPSWLAVLLFDAEDEAAFPGFHAQAVAGAVRDLFIRRTDAPDQAYSYFSGDQDLNHDSDEATLANHLEFGQSPSDPCQLLDVPLALFWQVAPSLDDLKMTAHVRKVDIQRKATQNGVAAGRNDLSDVPGTSEFALVLGNRVPKAGVRSFAHLVSLEGLEHFLPVDPATGSDAAEVTKPSAVPGADGYPIQPGGTLRLVSLRSWSFTSTGDSSHFEQLLLGLQPKMPGTPSDFAIGLPLPAPATTPSGAAADARKAIGMGFVPLRHQLRSGGEILSWYRGPLVPAPIADVLPPTLSSSDAATRYDPASGMFDLGYAGAWQIGRLLALQDKRVSTLLYQWRRTNLRSAVAQMEAQLLHQSLAAIHGARTSDDLVSPLLAAFAPSAPPHAAVQAMAALPATASMTTSVRFTASRYARAAVHRKVLTDVHALGLLVQPALDVPGELTAWFAALRLLDGVPFRYLVPDEAMLPPESIRFFHVDANWVHALTDGALSIGRTGTTQSSVAAHDAVVKPALDDQASGAARAVRPQALGIAAPAPAPLDTLTGFLLRSDVVKGWPGLEVNGYADDGTLLDIVRFERLAPGVLLCLFEKDGKAVKRVDIHEPAEGLHFGLSGGSSVNLRYNYAKGSFAPGSQVPGVFEPVPFRGPAASARVVRMFRLARALKGSAYAGYIQNIFDGFDHLPSSQFAMQMLRGVGLVTFENSGGAA